MSDEALEKLALRGDLNFENIVVLQIHRCVTTTDDPILYSINVDHLLRMMPPSVKKDRDFKNRLSELTQTMKGFQYKYSCGNPMGSPPIIGENGQPMRDSEGLIVGSVYRNKKGDWNWDGGEPILVSPKEVEEEVTDWQGVLELCLDTCDGLGISWKKLSKGGAR